MSEVCYSCFSEKSTAGACPRCGYDPASDAEKYPSALRAGSILNGRYIVGRVIGQGGFGITYLAQDYQTKGLVAIKEYLPTQFAGRTTGTYAVQVYSGDRRENFEYGKEQFLAESKTLAEFIGNDHIVRIYSYFEEYGTAYLAMEYIDGESLDKYMSHHGGRLSVERANELLIPVMEALDWVHSKGIVHRDIAPDNIIVTRDGRAKLIDFGAARYSTGEKSKSLDVILKYGFAPKEQYTRRGKQGAFTDVYAISATYYYAITGKIPPEAIKRLDSDELVAPSALGVKMSRSAEKALLNGLAISSSARLQSTGELAMGLDEQLVQRIKAGSRSIPQLPAQAASSPGKALAIIDERKSSFFSGMPELMSDISAVIFQIIGRLSGRASCSGNTWSFDELTGTLEIRFVGEMPNFLNPAARPWNGLSVKKVVIADYVTSIGDYAFSYFPDLTAVSVPDSVKRIGSYAFFYCTGLNRVDLCGGVEAIGKWAFGFCGSLAEMRIVNGVKKIGDYAFNNCTALRSVSISGTVENIGKWAFSCCGISDLKILNGVKKVGSYAFCGCTGLVNVYIPDSVSKIGRLAFYGCSGLRAVRVPNGVETKYAFSPRADEKTGRGAALPH